MEVVRLKCSYRSKVAKCLEEPPKRLPRPIVFWSINEKTAYRRNRVAQTRMNVLMEDIATQKESSRKSIRHEARKFRLNNSKYYSHPLGTNTETDRSAVNIAPANWKPPKESRNAQPTNEESDENCTEEPRMKGIITKTSAVRFSSNVGVHKIEEDFTDGCSVEKSDCPLQKTKQEEPVKIKRIRSVSAVQYREKPEILSNPIRRQYSAMQTTRFMENDGNGSEISIPARARSAPVRKPDSYFDKSKAACQLRQDLKRLAKLRIDGTRGTVFTRQDAINLEKEKYQRNEVKIVDYIKRMEIVKKMDQVMVNKWTGGSFMDQAFL